ncbi:hypothetical protein [Alkalitalea saponilacus]|uniref:Fe-S cluster assembly iron-binding protein IscA n=1 Tax=Alkalitalea saponilacus TaxID=889453 RepID=A0A1T5HSR0_9BACT|nr:hypothetical protein [Alkalitalea saponilacus]ASB49231.1 hypothetical protein CDL62_08815 [Alkalitalea saponilacus]SKC23716.1 hypothetical protein SAMN03080601_03001 [Alkalitalea saponilacus]
MELTLNAIKKLKEMLAVDHQRSKFIEVIVGEQKEPPSPEFSIVDEKKEQHKVVSIEGIPLTMSVETGKVLSGYIIDYKTHGFRVDFMLPEGRCCR